MGKKKKKEVSTLYQFTEETTLHGLQEFYSKNGIYRSIWFVFFFLVIAFGVVQVCLTTIEYADVPTAINIEFNKQTSFPPIALCPSPWITEDELNAQDLSALKPYLQQATRFTNFSGPELELQTDWSYVWDLIDSKQFQSFANLTLQISRSVSEYARFFNLFGLPNVKKMAKNCGVCLLASAFPVVEGIFKDMEAPSFVISLKNIKRVHISFGDTASAKSEWSKLYTEEYGHLSVYIKWSKFYMYPKSCVQDDDLTDEIRDQTCLSSCINLKLENCTKIAGEKQPLCNEYLASTQDRRDIFYKGPGDCIRYVSRLTNRARLCTQMTKFNCHVCPSRCNNNEVLVEHSRFQPWDNDYTTIAVYLMDHHRGQTIREVSVYSRTSLFSNIGGLVGLTCGASIMSVMHAILFCVQTISNRRQGV